MTKDPCPVEGLGEPEDAIRLLQAGICPRCRKGGLVNPLLHVHFSHGLDRFAVKDYLGVVYRRSFASEEYVSEKRAQMIAGWQRGYFDDRPRHAMGPRRPARAARAQWAKNGRHVMQTEGWHAKGGRAAWASGAAQRAIAKRVTKRKAELGERIHGTHSSYVNGCHCAACKKGHADYVREWNKRKRSA